MTHQAGDLVVGVYHAHEEHVDLGGLVQNGHGAPGGRRLRAEQQDHLLRHAERGDVGEEGLVLGDQLRRRQAHVHLRPLLGQQVCDIELEFAVNEVLGEPRTVLSAEGADGVHNVEGEGKVGLHLGVQRALIL